MLCLLVEFKNTTTNLNQKREEKMNTEKIIEILKDWKTADSLQELKEKFGDKFKLIDRPRKHRYIYFNCNKWRKKELLNKLKYEIKPYPKAA